MLEQNKEQNALFERAICFAVEKHAGQCRKGSDTPYIVHPLEVMEILLNMGADTNLLMAGLLHDTVEDTDTTLEELTEVFNADVARLVGEHSEDKSRSWEERKQRALAEVAVADKREQMLVLADKLSNIRAMHRDLETVGDKLWLKFNRPRAQQEWYYRAAIPALKDLGEYEDTSSTYFEFSQLVVEVFSNTEGVELLPEDLEDREVELFANESLCLSFSMHEKQATFICEEYADEAVGSESCEHTIDFYGDDTPKFLKCLRRDYGNLPLVELLQQQFGCENCVLKLERYCEDHNIYCYDVCF